MALQSYALTTVARLKTFMGVDVATHDTLLERLVGSVSDFVEKYCDRRFLSTAYSNQVYNGNGRNVLVLKQFPVVNGQTFTLQRRDSLDNQSSFSTIQSQDYFVEESAGIVTYVSGRFIQYPQHYRITFTAGYAFDNTTPGATLESVGIGDLEYAVWKLCQKAFDQRRQASNVESESIGDYSITLRKTVMVDDEVREILDKYRRAYEH